MNWRREVTNSPPGTGGVARRAGVVVKSKWFSSIPVNEWGGELFDPSTTPALRATPPVPGGELVLPLLRFIHTFYDCAFYEVFLFRTGVCMPFHLALLKARRFITPHPPFPVIACRVPTHP